MKYNLPEDILIVATSFCGVAILTFFITPFSLASAFQHLFTPHLSYHNQQSFHLGNVIHSSAILGVKTVNTDLETKTNHTFQPFLSESELNLNEIDYFSFQRLFSNRDKKVDFNHDNQIDVRDYNYFKEKHRNLVEK